MTQQLRTVDLFAGSGGLSLGFQKAGFDVVAAYDSWMVAVRCYRLNFQHPVIQADLMQSDEISETIKALRPDFIIGGPPCQDFSTAGKRNEGERASLTSSFARIVQTVQPKWFVMENVDRSFGSLAYSKARAIFKEAGYGLTERVLDASFCGVPQKRKRFFCVGLAGASDGFLHGVIDANLSEKPLTLREFFGEELAVAHYYRHPRNYSRRAIFSVDEPSPTIRGVNRPVPKGYPEHPGDPKTNMDTVRPLTTLERSRIQTFPKGFLWRGTKTEVEQMIGNAVPVKLAQFVANAIVEYNRLHLAEKERRVA
jgi:DNA (cytosine-5)-methyltransferase 1